MNKTENLADMGRIPYSRPECIILEIKPEGILCYSSQAEKFVWKEELEDNYYEQIF